jgi:hypothetical protein
MTMIDSIRRHVSHAFSAALLLHAAAAAAAEQTVAGGPANDYQATIVAPSTQPDSRLVVFERLGAGLAGDLWSTRSTDGGQTWSEPVIAIATAANERHAALVETGEGDYALFHLSGSGSSFRIHRASSADGITFDSHGPVELGPPAMSEINPHVIRRDDGTLVMTYHRLGGPAYIAQSADGGASWDTLRTQVSPGNAALPRIACREDDGTCLLVYQTGSNAVTLWVKTSADPYDWSAPARQLTTDGNNHDAFPMVLADGSFVVLWSRVIDGGFQVVSRRSHDGIAWQPMLQHTARAGFDNIQPHALPTASPHSIELYWGAAQTPGNGSADYDIVREPAALVADVLFADGFEVPTDAP